MKTGAERLQFAVRFAQMDLSTLRPGDWLNLLDDLDTFMVAGEFDRWEDGPGLEIAWETTGGVVARPDGRGEDPRLSQDALQALQTETLAILTAVVCPQADADGIHPLRRPPPDTAITVKTRVVSLKAFNHPRSRNILEVIGAPRDVFLYMLQLLLIWEPTNPIRVCPECSTLFYRIGKQQYCSRSCSNRANVRTWRQREEVKQAEAERAHTRYAKKKKPEPGRGPKVDRRPRKRSIGHAETPRES